MKSTLQITIAALLLLGCGSSEAPVEGGNEETTSGHEAEAGSYAFGVAVGDALRSGGQPTEADLRAAAAAGVTQVITLRGEEEPGQEGEEVLVAELGMSFVRIPVAGADGITMENAQALDEALSAGAPTLLHCGSGNRAGALLGLRAYAVAGASGDEALSAAADSGMTSLGDALRARLAEACADEPQRCPAE